jgi:hypothetical protein
LAEKYLNRAKEQGNPEDAERAWYLYQRIGDATGEHRARAWFEYLTEKPIEAANTIRSIDPHQASDWLWEAAAWKELDSWNLEPRWRGEIARQMLVSPADRGSPWLERMGNILNRQQGQIDEDYRRSIRLWYTWSQVLTETAEAASRLEERDPDLLDALWKLVHRWQDAPHKDGQRFHEALARIAFQRSLWKEAVEHWDAASHTEHRDYYLARAKTTDFPENLRWLESAGDWDEIVRLDEINRDNSLRAEDRRRVVRACLEKGRFRRAVELTAGDDDQRFCDLWGRLVSSDTTITPQDLRQTIKQALNNMRSLIRAETPSAPAEGEMADPTRAEQEASRQWSYLLLHTLEYLHTRVSGFATLPRERTWEPILLGFALSNHPEAIVSRFVKVWKERRGEQDQLWELHWKILDSLVHFAMAEFLEELKKAREAESIKRLILMTLSLVFERTTEVEDQDLKAKFYRVEPRIYLRAENPPGTTFLDDFGSQYHHLVRKVIVGVGQIPPDLIRDLEGHQWRSLRELLDGIAYRFFDQAKSWNRAASEPPSREMLTWIRPMGDFVLRSNFRKLAVAYFEEMQKVSESWRLPQDIRQHITSGLRQAKADLREFRGKKEFGIGVGDEYKGRALVVRSLASRPEVILEVLPDYHQARLILNRSTGELQLQPNPPLVAQGPRRIGQVREWILRNQTGAGPEIRITWPPDRNRLRVEAQDEVFNVDLGGS